MVENRRETATGEPLHMTRSLCPECLRQLRAAIVAHDDGTVWMERTCPDHGLPGTNGIGILITLKDINADKRIRHIDSYSEKNLKLDRKRLFRVNMRRLPW